VISPDTESLQTDSPVTFVPNPLRDGWLVYDGRVQNRELHDTPAGPFSLLFTDLPVKPGDSGSGLYDSRGQLVGLNTWTRMGGGQAPQGISLPSEAMRAIVEAIDQDRLDSL
jgi:S1-C subfamily serine protease